MDLSKEYKFAYRIIKENPQLYQLFKRCIMSSKNLGYANKHVLMKCIEDVLSMVTLHTILSIYNILAVPKQVFPIIGKQFHVKVFNLLGMKKGPRVQTVVMECTGYDRSRNTLLFGKTRQPISTDRLSMVDDENFNVDEFLRNLPNNIKDSDYICEKKLKLHYLHRKYSHIFIKDLNG